MKKHFAVKIMLVSLFVAAVMCLVAQPALAGGKSNNKGKNETAVNAQQKGEKSQEEIDQILAIGPPPVKDQPGWYIKKVPGTGEYIQKYFKNGHPINNSGWVYYGPDEPPYGK